MKQLFVAIIVMFICVSIFVACANDNDNSGHNLTYPEYLSGEANSDDTTNAVSENVEPSQTESESNSGADVEAGETNTEKSPETEGRTEITTDGSDTDSIHVDSDENFYCDICGTRLESETIDQESYTISSESALFEKFYDNSFDIGLKEHSNGSKMTEDSNTFYSDDGSILKFENYSNLYKNARDAIGNPTLKLGKSDTLGSFEITIPQNVNIVILKIAKYKDQDSTVIINGREYTLIKQSDNGEYDEIIIDTATFKMITVSTTKEHTMCMIRSIEFIK